MKSILLKIRVTLGALLSLCLVIQLGAPAHFASSGQGGVAAPAHKKSAKRSGQKHRAPRKQTETRGDASSENQKKIESLDAEPSQASTRSSPASSPIDEPLAAGSGIVRAQTPPAATSQTRSDPAYISKQRVGVDENQIERLSLQDAIALALQKNLDLEMARESVQVARYSVFAASGIYDKVVSAEFKYYNQSVPVASIFSGGGSSSSVNEATLLNTLSVNQQIERTGGFWQANFSNSRTNTSSTAATLTTQYNPSITFTFVQPLMRNLSIDLNRRTIQLARRQLDISDSQFRQRVIEIINSVQSAYWDLSFALRNEQITRDAVELTRIQLENNKTLIEAGAIAPIEIRSIRAALESRKGDVLLALQSITTAENVLKTLITNDPGDRMWNSQIIPTDDPVFGQSTLGVQEATHLAFTNRTELEQLRLLAKQKEIEVRFFRDQTRTQVDLIGLYTSSGLAGTPSGVVEEFGLSGTTLGIVNSLNDVRSRLGLGRFVPRIPPPTTVGASTPEIFRGGYFQSLRNLFSQNYRTVQFGIRVTLPWGNHTSEGNLGRALAETRHLDARQRQIMQMVQAEVRNSIQAIETARQRFEAARENRDATQAQLRGEEERFQAGLSTNFFVLQRQTELALARAAEARALIDYNKALANLERVTGVTLIKQNVEIFPPGELNKPNRGNRANAGHTARPASGGQ
jgi:HAE1 family hydrophobic/amphiphilic exporter-1